MKNSSEEKEAYLKGISSYKSVDTLTARHYFETCLSYNGTYKDDALIGLARIDIKEGKYLFARQKLNDITTSSPNSFLINGLLENIENNFQRSKVYYQSCLNDTTLQHKALLALSKLYIQTGDNDIAKIIFKTLKQNKHFETQALIELVCLNILEKNYDEAYNVLKEINWSKLTPKLLHHYNILKIYIYYCQGKIDKIPANTNMYKDERYIINRISSSSDDILLDHISRHTDQRNKNTTGYLFEDIDLKKLLADVKEIIKDINPNHFEISDMYRFSLDTKIGMKSDVITSDICVVTLLDTQNILTMYPILLSNDFDKEGMSKSKELMLKRRKNNYDK